MNFRRYRTYVFCSQISEVLRPFLTTEALESLVDAARTGQMDATHGEDATLGLDLRNLLEEHQLLVRTLANRFHLVVRVQALEIVQEFGQMSIVVATFGEVPFDLGEHFLHEHLRRASDAIGAIVLQALDGILTVLAVALDLVQILRHFDLTIDEEGRFEDTLLEVVDGWTRLTVDHGEGGGYWQDPRMR